MRPPGPADRGGLLEAVACVVGYTAAAGGLGMTGRDGCFVCRRPAIGLEDLDFYFDSWLHDGSPEAEVVTVQGAWGRVHGACLSGSDVGRALALLRLRWLTGAARATVVAEDDAYWLVRPPSRGWLVRVPPILQAKAGPWWSLRRRAVHPTYNVVGEVPLEVATEVHRALRRRDRVPLLTLVDRLALPLWDRGGLASAVLRPPRERREFAPEVLYVDVKGQRRTMPPEAAEALAALRS